MFGKYDGVSFLKAVACDDEDTFREKLGKIFPWPRLFGYRVAEICLLVILVLVYSE